MLRQAGEHPCGVPKYLPWYGSLGTNSRISAVGIQCVPHASFVSLDLPALFYLPVSVSAQGDEHVKYALSQTESGPGVSCVGKTWCDAAAPSHKASCAPLLQPLSQPVWKLEAGQRVPHCKAQELASCPSSHEEPLGACKGPPRGLTAQHRMSELPCRAFQCVKIWFWLQSRNASKERNSPSVTVWEWHKHPRPFLVPALPRRQ